MPSSLTAQVATKLIMENNGRTAKEIIRDGLDRGIIRGTVAGQVGALVKLYIHSGSLPDVRRDEQRRPYRYYLKGSTVVQQQPKVISEPITFRPTSEQEEILMALIETRKYSNRSEAVNWLLNEGIASKQVDIRRIIQTYREIERLRQEVQQIGS